MAFIKQSCLVCDSYGEILGGKSLLLHYHHCCHRRGAGRIFVVEFQGKPGS
jgi:hypothetical protein